MRVSKLIFYLWAGTAFIASIKRDEDCSLDEQCVDGKIVQVSSPLPYTADAPAQEGDDAAMLNDNFQDAVLARTTGVLTQTLPKIVYNRDELDEIIEKISLDEDKKFILNRKLEFIGSRIDSIHDCSRSKNPASFYQDMRMAITEIGDAAKQIYELAKPRGITLATELQKKILGWIGPLAKELARITEISASERRELEFKTKRLYAQQSFFYRQEILQSKLMEHLKEIKEMLLDAQSLEPHCYLSYAWPSPENKEHEYCIQPFLSILYDHLHAAGIEMIMDIRNNEPDQDIYQFTRKYKDGNHVILVGTESLLQKHESYKAHTVKTELSIINVRFEHDMEQFGESRIYPLLISGTRKSSFPEIYDKYLTVRESRDMGYALLLKNLIEWLYSLKIEREAGLKLKYQALWNKFYKNYPGLPRDCAEALVKQELAEGYHRKLLDELNQNLTYQSIKAQQEVKHSEAVTTKIIAVYMESIGPVPKALFEENGQQFQRPYTNTNFVERKSLWDKMLAHFASQEKLVLMAAHGLGGMGKTELAGYYYLHPPRPYSLRAWFYAQSRAQLYQQYIKLSEANGKFFAKEISIEEQALRVKTWLEEQKDCLLVYDNVENVSEIDGLLPQQGKHHILITSRNSGDFPAEQCLNVDVMEQCEAIDLIIKITGVNKDRNIVQLKELVHELGYLPLALAQAAGYMGKTTSIAQYLDLYRQHQTTLLNNKDEKNPLLPKHEPIWITFDINFNTLNMDFPPAIATLKQTSWVGSAAIPEILLLNIVESYAGVDDKFFIWSNIKKHVHRYSFMRINVEQHVMYIHPLLQDILRIKQTEVEQIKIFKDVSAWLNNVFEYLKENNMDYKGLLAHAERLHQHGQNVALLAKGQSDANSELLPLEPNSLGDLYFNLGLAKKALKIFTQQKEIYEKYQTVDHTKMLYILGNIGNAHLHLGNAKEAKQYYEKVLEIQEKRNSKDHVNTMATLGNLCTVCRMLGDLQEGKSFCERALEINDARDDKDNFEMVAVLGNLGTIHRELGSIKEARLYCERALMILKNLYKEGHLNMIVTAGVLENLGTVYLELSYLKEAKEHFERALNIQENYYEVDHFETATSLNNLCTVYRILGDLEKAKTLCDRALKIQEDHHGIGHVETTDSLVNIGIVYLELYDLKKAKEYCERALRIQIDNGSNHIKTVASLVNLGTVSLRLGELTVANEYYVRALKIEQNYYRVDHIKTARTLVNLGTVYLQLGKIEQSREYYENALKIQEDYYGGGNIEVANTLGELGNAYRRLGLLKEAKQSGERALKAQETFYGSGHIATAANLRYLGTACLELNELEEAKDYCDRSLKISEVHGDKNYVDRVANLGNLGIIYLRLEEFENAKVCLLRAKELCNQNLVGKNLHLEKIEMLLKNIPEINATKKVRLKAG